MTQGKNICIITLDPFPIGGANTNRIITIGKALIVEKNNVTVICLKPTELENNITNFNSVGFFEEIHYRYLYGTTIIKKKPKSKFVKYLYQIYNNIKFQILLISYLRNVHFDITIITFEMIFVKFIIKKVLRRKLIQEINECPEILISGFRLKLIVNLSFKLNDGLIVITNNLLKYFIPYLNVRCKTFILPMTVDISRFNFSTTVVRENYITYCGNLNEHKDGVLTLLKAFRAISNEISEYNLILIGQGDDLMMDKIHHFILSNNMSSRITIITRLSREYIPTYLLSSKILILPRPTSIQAYYGFPTKLGEYLATGNLVIATKVGEIPFYLKDMKNAILAEPNNISSLASCIKFAVYNKDMANSIGQNGFNLAKTKFNYLRYSAKFNEYLNCFK